MTTLQNLPTQNWQDSEIEELTAEAYRLKYMFADAPQHYKQKTWSAPSLELYWAAWVSGVYTQTIDIVLNS